MKRSRAPFEVAKSGRAIYVRLHGLGNMNNAPTLEAFSDRMIDKGARQFVFDLDDCAGVDSTFMGLILTIANRLHERSGDGKSKKTAGCVLINVDDHAQKQLSSVGVDAFVAIKAGDTKLPAALRLTPLDHQDVSDRERLKLMVRAHRELVASDDRNKAKFGAFLKAIVAELG